MPEYDYLIVGAGLFGSVFAQRMTELGKRCIVIDRRAHIGGNVHCEELAGIQVHRYGAHIFHTSDRQVWDYVNRFSTFNHYVNAPIAVWEDEVYNLPFNMNTFSKLWGVRTPAEAQAILRRQAAEAGTGQARNLEEQALRLVGRDIYEKLVKGYTEKQWGRDCRELPPFLIRRLPLRFTYDNNYFSDPFQGIPTEGYDAMVRRLLRGSRVLPGTDYHRFCEANPGIAGKTVFTGAIDEFFRYRLGALEYRTLRFEDEVLDCENWQGNAVVNYTQREIPYTRIIEHKHFVFGTQPQTVITREYPEEWRPGAEPFYPVNDRKNQALYEAYRALARERADVIFGGRLGEYRYYNMDQVIRAALDAAERELRGKDKEE